MLRCTSSLASHLFKHDPLRKTSFTFLQPPREAWRLIYQGKKSTTKDTITLLKVSKTGVSQLSKKVTRVNKQTLTSAMASIAPSSSSSDSTPSNEDYKIAEIEFHGTSKKIKKPKINKAQELKKLVEDNIVEARKSKKNLDLSVEVSAHLEALNRIGDVEHSINASHVLKHKAASSYSTTSFESQLRNQYLHKNYYEMFKVRRFLVRKKFEPNATIFAYLLSALSKTEERYADFKDRNITYADYCTLPIPIGSKHYEMFAILFKEEYRQKFILDEIRSIFALMETKCITLDKLFNEAEFVLDVKKYTLKAVRKIEADYVPPPIIIPQNPGYTVSLLKNLNINQTYGITGAFDENPKKLFTEDSKKDSEYSVSLKNIENQLHDTERLNSITVKSIYDGSFEAKYDSELKGNLQTWKEKWRLKFKKILHVDIRKMNNNLDFFYVHPKDITVRPFLIMIGVDAIVNAMIEEVDKLATTSQVMPEFRLHGRLGRRLYSHYAQKHKDLFGVTEKREDIYLNYCKIFEKYADKGMNFRLAYMQLCEIHRDGMNLNCKAPEWPYSLQKQIGKYLYNILVNEVSVWIPGSDNKIVRSPALCRKEVFEKFSSHIGIEAHANLVKLYRLDQELVFSADELPMVSPPIPWTSEVEGGYFSMANDILRVPIGSSGNQRSRLSENTYDMRGPMDSLNVLGSIPWRINTSILDIVIKIFNENSGEDLEVPPHPNTLVRPDVDPMSPEEAVYEKKKGEMNSLWCTALYKLSIANHFRDRVLWFPHNMDFRGRAYPIHPHLSQVDSDLFRSMLFFAEKKPLGKMGLSWLKVHLVNLTGLCKKASMAARLQFCEDSMSQIIDSAERPLDGDRWWTKSDEPWQTLAACMELSAAMQCDKPHEYMSGLPIHQDGSCNGLQHYAALGRDKEGAKSVNLMPSDTPQDVYVAVAEIVEDIRSKDAANGVEIASTLEGFIQRKVVKQTIMTTVYGVTSYGAAAQIEKQLKAIEAFPQQKSKEASRYLTKAIFESLRQMFTSARKIQDWLTDCSNVITKVRGESVQWVTPLGLPIVQPYVGSLKVTKLLTMIPSSRDRALRNMELPSTVKQKNAFPPNFVHSLDASHMMLTALNCAQKGITFASVHDCYWTHACSVNKMNVILRDQFVELYTEPILHQLSDYFNQIYNFSEQEYSHDGSAQDSKMFNLKQTLSDVPVLGKFEIDKVKSSIFFFSWCEE